MDGNSRLRRHCVIIVMAILMLAFGLLTTAGCGGDNGAADNVGPDDANGRTGREIPLQTLAQGVTSDYGRIDDIPFSEDAPPECLAISDEEEFQRLLSLAYFPEPMDDIDFDRYIVIAAMQGPKNTGGYAISIMHALQAGTEIRVEVDVVEPEPGSMTAQVLTSPYHLVLAERSAFDPSGELVFTFIDQDDVRISQQFIEL